MIRTASVFALLAGAVRAQPLNAQAAVHVDHHDMAPMATEDSYPSWQTELESLAASHEPPVTVEEYVESLEMKGEEKEEMTEFLEMAALEEGYTTPEEWKLSKRQEMATYRQNKSQAEALREATLEAVAADKNVTVDALKAQIEAQQLKEKAMREEAVEVLADAEDMTVEEYTEKVKEERQEARERFQAMQDKCEEASGEEIKSLQEQIAEDRGSDLLALNSDPHFDSNPEALTEAAKEVLEVYAGNRNASEVAVSNPDGKSALEIIAAYHDMSVDDLVDDRSAFEEIRVQIAACAGYESVEAMQADREAYRQEKQAEKEEKAATLQAHFGDDHSEVMKENAAEKRDFMQDWNTAAEETGLTVTQMEMNEQRDEAEDYWNAIRHRAEDEGISVQQAPSHIPAIIETAPMNAHNHDSVHFPVADVIETAPTNAHNHDSVPSPVAAAVIETAPMNAHNHDSVPSPVAMGPLPPHPESDLTHTVGTMDVLEEATDIEETGGSEEGKTGGLRARLKQRKSERRSRRSD